MKAGDLVRLKQPERLAYKYQNREIIVVRTYTRLGSNSETAVVRFLKRAGRGKEFEEHFPSDRFVPNQLEEKKG